MALLGIHGKMGSGKDTVLERLHHLQPDTFTRASFADKLKDSACALLGIDRELMEVLKREEYNFLSIWHPEHSERSGSPILEMTMRTFLQRYGTEAHRDIFGSDFWVGHAMADLDEERVSVFTDVRFENEARAIKAEGGVVWHVLGNEPTCTCDAPPRDYLDVAKAACPLHDTHASEVVIPSHLLDVTIDNTVRDDGFASLDAQLAALLKEPS